VNLVCIGNWGKATLRNNLYCLLFQPQSCELLPAISVQGGEAQTIKNKQKIYYRQGRPPKFVCSKTANRVSSALWSLEEVRLTSNMGEESF